MLSDISNLIVIKFSFVITLMVITSYMDLKKREIPLKVWVVSLPLAILLTLAEYLKINYIDMKVMYIYITGLFISIGLSIIFYIFDFFGGADMFALITLSIAFPIIFVGEYIIPPQLLLILYASLTGLLFSLGYFTSNIVNKNWKKLPENLGILQKIALMFLGIPVKPEDYVKMKFYYPLTIYDCRGKPQIRFSFSIEEEYEDFIEHVKELIKNKCISNETYLWVTYGIPFLINIYIGFLLTLLLKDSWLVFLIK